MAVKVGGVEYDNVVYDREADVLYLWDGSRGGPPTTMPPPKATTSSSTLMAR